LNIVVKGEFNLPSRLRIGSNKSLIGHKSGAHIGTNGINIVNGTNVILRNLKITGVLDNDCITIQNTTRVWVDHNEFYSSPDIIGDGPDKYVSGSREVYKALR
jgi:pectate lyase